MKEKTTINECVVKRGQMLSIIIPVYLVKVGFTNVQVNSLLLGFNIRAVARK
jgi:hypothetical protein